MLPENQAPPPFHSLNTCSMAIFACWFLSVWNQAGQACPCWPAGFPHRLPACLDAIPTSCPSCSCLRVLHNSHLFQRSFSKTSQMEGLLPLAEVLDRWFGTCCLYRFTWLDAAFLCIKSVLAPCLPFPCPLGCSGTMASSSLPLTLARPSPAPQVTDTQGV